MVTWQGLRTNTAATRFYLYMTAIPGQLQTIFQFIASGGAGYSELAWFSIDLTGKVAVTDATATTLWLSPAAISLNTWYRFEIFASVGATQNTGTIQAAYYTLDNGSAIASFNTSTADLGINPIGWARFGKIGPTSYATPFYIDDIGVVQNAAGFIGSYAAAPSPPATYSGIIPHLGWGRSL